MNKRVRIKKKTKGNNTLYTQVRPANLDQLVGQSKAISKLKGFLSRGKLPHVLLIHGPAGCGKTTIARILKTKLNCGKIDYVEKNGASFNGVADARLIEQRMSGEPIQGDCRIWLIDECFPKGSLVSTPNGQIPIEKIKPKQPIFSLNGTDIVEGTFVNEVYLDRVVKISFSNGSHIYCTKEHLFLTDNGWKKCLDLSRKDLIFLSLDSKSMANMDLLERIKNENMQILSEDFNRQTKKTSILQQYMFNKMEESTARIQTEEKREECTKRTWHNGGARMFSVWFFLRVQYKQVKKILFPKLCWQMEESTARIQTEGLLRRSIEKNKRFSPKVQQNEEGERASVTKFQTHGSKQSNEGPKKHKENEGNEKDQWDTSYLERQTWWEWALHKASNVISFFFRMGDGGFCGNKKKISLPPQLQSGYSKQRLNDSYRSRWERTQIEKEYRKRCEKNKDVRTTRVESVEIYKRGHNESSFEGVITDKERNKGFVNFYDLQVKNHPSYFVENIAVHNCHRISTQAWDVLLKPLEDTPDHVYFFLCTTEPQKIKKTIRTRCTDIKVESISETQLRKLVTRTIKQLKIELDKEVLDTLIEAANGSARQALVLLQSIMQIEDAEEQIEELKSKDLERTSKSLVHLLTGKKPVWKEVSALLQKIKENKQEAEGIRIGVINYCMVVALKNPKMAARCYMIYDSFAETFIYTGMAGLTFACYETVVGIKDEDR